MIAAVVFALAAAGPAAGSEAQVRFTAAVEQAKAHLLLCRELYGARQVREAALHASHPVQELGGKIFGPIKRADAALGERVQTALKQPRRDVDAKVPRADFERNLDATVALLDEAVARVVPAAVTGGLSFKLAVLREMFAGLEKEYGEAEKKGKITQIVEYHDAYAFSARIQALYRDLAPALRQASAPTPAVVEERLALLARGFPGLTPPTSPIPMATLHEHLVAIARALDAVTSAS